MKKKRFWRISIGVYSELLLLSAVALMLWAVAVHNDAYEQLHDFIEAHEALELDEVLVGLICAGLMGFVFAVRRMNDFRREARFRRSAETQASWTAVHDALTGLPNRRFLEQQAVQMIGERGGMQCHAVLAIDLDGFKRVNDLIGHDGGDALLADIAQRLRRLFPDDIVVRLGGDEFVVICKTAPALQLTARAEEIISLLSCPVAIKGVHVEIGACVGIAAPSDRQAATLKDLLLRADYALYSGKKAGRGCAMHYDPAMDGAMSGRAKLEQQLRRAVREKAIVPHYQPLIDLETGNVRGFEVLARWEPAPGQFIPPDEFIQIADDIGIIIELSENLLRRACTDALNWPAHLKIAFNVAPSMMGDRLLAHRILAILADTGLAPRQLEIEVTESALVRDLDTATAVINSLRKEGVTFALDDFGTGYSSLSQLSNLTFDYIKIDRAFVEAVGKDKKRLKIVKSIIALADGLDIPTTAEGIERPEQLAQLKSLDCKFGQGYLFARPMTFTEATGFLQNTAAPEGIARLKQA